MALRPPRAGFSVARLLSERARGARPKESAGNHSDPDIAAAGGFSGMVDALRGLVQQLAEAAQSTAQDEAKAAHEASKEGTHSFTLGGARTSVVFGYTLKTGPDGVSAERFGDVPDRTQPPAKAASQPQRQPPRQPIVEVHEEGAEIVVVAELPGADPKTIICRPEQKRLLIEAGGARRYRKEVLLPAAVQASGMQQSFQHGILEVRLVRADPQ
jgi:HSP20 family protein